MNNFRFLRLTLILAATAPAWGTDLIVAPYPDETPDLAHNIRMERAFIEPIVSVGEATPPEMESRVLWSDLLAMRKAGPKAGIPLLEEFIRLYPGSAWTPLALTRNDPGLLTKMDPPPRGDGAL